KSQMQSFVYKTKGSMAKIGKRNGVALLMGHKIRGLLAWLIWRQYYLTHLPTTEKKIRVAFDWLINMFFEPDITRLRNLKEKSLTV
ncbi:MAG: NAD(P)/FAD-dependent oxidoreductase, partial [Thaumarchaeota archaeon]|nr:NAD(P)/FAD-dependent oxidoreductase [Nitrososphaerota archaeon]